MTRCRTSTALRCLTPNGDAAPTLVLGIGNPSRGDDALGPSFVERLEALGLAGVECQTDFQLQVEHALDVAGRERVVFVDATAAEGPPFTFDAAAPARDASFTTHALSPAAVLETCLRLTGRLPSDARVLAIRGERFGLGEPLSERAAANLDAALAALVESLAAVHAASPPERSFSLRNPA